MAFTKKSHTCNICSLKEFCHDIELNSQELLQFEKITSRKIVVEKGGFLFEPGDSVAAIYVVQSGSVKLVNGKAKIIDFYFSGDFIGLDAFDSSLHKTNAIAIEQTIFCIYDYTAIMKLINKIPRFSQFFLKILSKQLAQHFSSFNRHMDATQRICSFFKNISDRNQARGFSATHFTLSMKRHDIANFLDLANETLSRTLQTLTHENVIRVENKQVHILDMDTLENKCSEA
jgi:CRP/FNR family transcriptional regulator, anaerobic regulatory protein